MSARSKILGSVAIVALAAVGYMAPASAVPVNCIDTTHDYMKVDSSLVSSCLAAGVGNIGQNNDPFLAGLSPERRATLVTVPDHHGLVFDVRLQGDRETVFLRFPRHE